MKAALLLLAMLAACATAPRKPAVFDVGVYDVDPFGDDGADGWATP